MRVSKGEKIWIILTVIFYVLYNIPGLPAHGDQMGAMIHAILTVGPLWVVVFVGTKLIYKKYPLKDQKGEK